VKLADTSLIPAARNAIKHLPEVASTELDEKNGRITAFPAPGKLPLASINALAEKQHWPLTELHLESGRLDEVFRTITGGATA
jgi:ABC-2 type transport system ATP-binding protein